MSSPVCRRKVSFASRWAYPEPKGACFDQFIEAICIAWEDMPACHRPAAHAWRYLGEVNNGGHVQYISNLARNEPGFMELIPEAIRGMSSLGMDDAARILQKGWNRWLHKDRPPIHVLDLGLKAYRACQAEFRDIDEEFYNLDRSGNEDATYGKLRQHLERNLEVYLELEAPMPEDQVLIGLGPNAAAAAIPESMWLTLATHVDEFVKLRAATELVTTHPQVAADVAREIIASQRARDERPANLASSLLCRLQEKTK